MIKHLKWYMSVIGLLVSASVHAIDFLDMKLLGEVFLNVRKVPSSVTILAIVTTLLGFLITWLFIRRIVKPLKIKEFKIFIFTFIAYLISIGGWVIRFFVGAYLIFQTSLGWWGLLIVYIPLNALLFTVMIALMFPNLSWWIIFKNMIYANILSFLASILCVLIFYKIYPAEQPNFFKIISQPKREPDRIREMVKNMPYSHDLSESDFR